MQAAHFLDLMYVSDEHLIAFIHVGTPECIFIYNCVYGQNKEKRELRPLCMHVSRHKSHSPVTKEDGVILIKKTSAVMYKLETGDIMVAIEVISSEGI